MGLKGGEWMGHGGWVQRVKVRTWPWTVVRAMSARFRSFSLLCIGTRPLTLVYSEYRSSGAGAYPSTLHTPGDSWWSADVEGRANPKLY